MKMFEEQERRYEGDELKLESEGELSFYGLGIESIEDLDSELRGSCKKEHIDHMRIMHCDSLLSLYGIQQFPALLSLDLGSNSINSMLYLQGLHNLKNLNLSCNEISKVDSLQNLTSLVKLDLSHNSIMNLQGFINVKL
jgi:internalin A